MSYVKIQRFNNSGFTVGNVITCYHGDVYYIRYEDDQSMVYTLLLGNTHILYGTGYYCS